MKLIRKDALFHHESSDTCLAIVKSAYEELAIGQTLRHYYYKLLSCGALVLSPVPNSGLRAYQYVSRLLVDAREQGLLPWEALIDPGRRTFSHACYQSVDEYVAYESQSSYSLDIWRGQQYRIECFIEKDAMAEIVDSIVSPYRIPVHVAKGYNSATVIERAATRYKSGDKWLVFYCGDFDPTGLDIDRSFRDELALHGAYPAIERIALTLQDTLSLPDYTALNIKETDSRSKKFLASFGPEQKAYELDALPVADLKAKLLDAIHRCLDVEAFNKALQLERVIRDRANKRLEQALQQFRDASVTDGYNHTELSMSEVLLYLLPSDEYEMYKQA